MSYEFTAFSYMFLLCRAIFGLNLGGGEEREREKLDTIVAVWFLW